MKRLFVSFTLLSVFCLADFSVDSAQQQPGPRPAVGSIRGTITSKVTKNLKAVVVAEVKNGNNWVKKGEAASDASSGKYVIANLAPGQYQVRLSQSAAGLKATPGSYSPVKVNAGQTTAKSYNFDLKK
jgi:hypothetical protein